MQKWSYLYVSFYAYEGRLQSKNPVFASEEEMFSALGAEGWELVSVVPMIGSNTNFGGTYTAQVNFYFKRPVSD